MKNKRCYAYTYDADTNSCSAAKVRCRMKNKRCNAYTYDADTNSCSAAKVRCRIKYAMQIHMMLITSGDLEISVKRVTTVFLVSLWGKCQGSCDLKIL